MLPTVTAWPSILAASTKLAGAGDGDCDRARLAAFRVGR